MNSMWDLHQIYFEMLFTFIKQQNEKLLHEIAVRENLSEKALHRDLLPSKRTLREYLKGLANVPSTESDPHVSK